MPWWYELRVAAERPGRSRRPPAASASSSSTGWRRSRTPTRSSCPAGTASRHRRWSRRSARPTSAARGWCRSAAGSSSSPPRACSTAGRRRRTGATRPARRAASRRQRQRRRALRRRRHVLTSAGSAAGIDLCLHIVRRDHGSAVANAVARRLVIPPHRDGGQAQLIDLPMPAHPTTIRSRGVMAWALERLDEPLDLDALAGRAYMSVRTFTRRFRKATGTTPGRWLLEQRVRASLALLETRTRRSRPWPGRSASRARRRSGITSPRSCTRRRPRTGARSTRPRRKSPGAPGRGEAAHHGADRDLQVARRPRCSRGRRRRRPRRPHAAPAGARGSRR